MFVCEVFKLRKRKTKLGRSPNLVDSLGEPLLTMEDLETAKALAQQFELVSREFLARFSKNVLKTIKNWLVLHV